MLLWRSIPYPTTVQCWSLSLTRIRVSHTNCGSYATCSRAANDLCGRWRDVRPPVTESQPFIPLTFYMLYRENISPFRVREILFSYV